MSSLESWLHQARCCVTGGSGVLGNLLVRRLIAHGAAAVVVFDRSAGSSGQLQGLAGPVEHIAGSILDEGALAKALQGCSVVFHLAALTHVGQSQRAPLTYMEVNGLGTASVLEACRRQGVERVIYTSTGHVYGRADALPIAEDHPTRPLSIYAASKLAGEVAVQGYAAGYGLSAAIARLANLYGAALGAETVVGRALEQVVSGEPIRLRNLSAVRDFVYLEDAAEALLRLAASARSPGCQVANVASGRGVSILEVAQTLAAVAAQQGLGTVELAPPEEVQREAIPAQVLDNSRLRALTGWAPATSLAAGLGRALAERRAQERV